jgi:AraC-like DNA-binding protein
MVELPEANEVEAGKQAWRARWYVWDGGFLTLGRGQGAIVPLHSHHAIQVSLGLDGPIGHRTPDSEWRRCSGLMVAPDVEHEFETATSLLAILLVDPETREGRWLRRSTQEPITEIPPAKTEDVLATVRRLWAEPEDAPETATMIHSVTRRLCAGPPPPYALDERIVRALEIIRRTDTRKLSLEAVAKAVFLSSSRFAHLFTEQVGLPFRRYVLWRRLTRAMLAVGRGHTLSAAAHACGFADSAHLTRTCYQMFGLPPSLLLSPGEFFEIPAPFELPFPIA